MSVRTLALAATATLAGFLTACGPSGSNRGECAGGDVDVTSDPSNCGSCGTVCAANFACLGGRCLEGECLPGTEQDCYDGLPSTINVGPCRGGTRTCDDSGHWSPCTGQVVPVGEDGAKCTDGIDNNCNSMVDEDVDADGDGLTTCGGDCCDSTECTRPSAVNHGAFDAPGNNFDDDCNGVADDTLLLCDQAIASNTQDPLDFARAIDLCQTTTATDPRWGVISGALTLTDGTGVPDPEAHAVRPKFGSGLMPQGGVNLAILSTGGAAAKGDTLPGYHEFVSYTHAGSPEVPFPADFLAANAGNLPNAPGCPEPLGDTANDPVMLTLDIKVPTNAKSFKLSTNFYSAEFPEWTCSAFNDFFAVLLDSTYTGTPANPTDKNLAFYVPMGGTAKVPVGVNLGHGNTGLFTQCQNGETGCSGSAGTITTCTGLNQLANTGFDDAEPGSCAANSIVGGATGWLVTSGNVVPGEIIKLRIAVWDTSDHAFDSLAVIDGFQWSLESTEPGTVIFKTDPKLPALPTEATVTSQSLAR